MPRELRRFDGCLLMREDRLHGTDRGSHQVSTNSSPKSRAHSADASMEMRTPNDSGGTRRVVPEPDHAGG